MKTAIIDTQTTGHHPEYIYGLWSKLNQRKEDQAIDIFCDSYLYKYIGDNDLQVITEKGASLKVDKLENPIGTWFQITKSSIKNLWTLRGYDKVTFLSLNSYLPALFLYAVFHKSPFALSGIFFDPHARKVNDWKNWLRDVTLRYILRRYVRCEIFILNDKEAVGILNRRYSTDAFRVITDPIPEFYYHGIRSDCKKVGVQFTFTMLGSIAPRKGVFQFLSAIKMSKSRARFVLAGRIDERISDQVRNEVDLLNRDGFSIEIHDRFVANREFAEFVSGSDVLVIPYLSKGASSGILGHAAFAKKCVIGPREGMLSELIRDFNLGFAVDPNDIKAFSDLINELPLKQMDTGGHNRYVAGNSLDQFYSEIVA